MQSRLRKHRLVGWSSGSRISVLMVVMLATLASIYVAGRLWQDAENRVYLMKELDHRAGQGQQSVLSVDGTMKVIECREQQKKLSAIEMELATAKKEGFVSKYPTGTNGAKKEKKLLAVIGIITQFGRQKNRDAIRRTWMPSGATLEKLEDQKGIVARFVIGRSANRGDSLDRQIDIESRQTNDFVIIDDLVEASEEQPKKTKLFFAHAADTWDAEFYVKVNDDVLVNIDGLAVLLSSYLDKPRAYIGCMRSGEVFSEPGHHWYEPDWWKFGDGLSYFRHASSEIFVISQALAQFVSINRSILRTFAHDDVSAGSWFIGLDVKHIDEEKLCCTAESSGAICEAA